MAGAPSHQGLRCQLDLPPSQSCQLSSTRDARNTPRQHIFTIHRDEETRESFQTKRCNDQTRTGPCSPHSSAPFSKEFFIIPDLQFLLYNSDPVIYIHIYIIYIYTHIHIYTICTHTHTYIIYVYTHIHIYNLYTHTYIHIIYIHTHTYIHNLYTHNLYIHTHTYIQYIYTHTYI